MKFSKEKEYLNKTTGEYRKTSGVVTGDNWVEIPEGAEIAVIASSNKEIYFWKSGGKYIFSNKWLDCSKNNRKTFGDFIIDLPKSNVIWQRDAKPELAKKESVLDTGRHVVESYESKDEKHSHYKKDVSNLDFVDVYRVLDLFSVNHPCIQHAVKKLLCAGQRGAKDLDQDIEEAIDSLVRFQEMRKEDEK